MRLLILLGGQVFSGAEITTLRFAAALSGGWEIAVAAHPAVAAAAGRFGFPVLPWRHESAPGDPLLRASHFANPPPPDERLQELVAAFRPEVVLACLFPVALLALPVLQRHAVPLVIHHQLMYRDLPEHPITGAVRRAAAYAQAVVAASRAVETPLRRAGIENVAVIPAGLPAAYGTPRIQRAGPVRLLAMGTWGPVKGLETLLDAAAQLWNEGLVFDLHVVGPLDRYSREYAAAIRRRAHPAVRFSAETATPEVDYREADILVVPSSEPDPYPTVTLEGMAHRLAVVATDCGGLPEQVDDGVTGLLVPPNDAPRMAGALRRLMAHPEQTAAMGLAGERRLRAIADLREQAALFETLLNRSVR